MNTSNFISLDIVQTVAMYSYLNTLSDILFSENFLNKTDKHKPIPVINALYHYLSPEFNAIQSDNIQRKKTYLITKIIEGSDLYGGKEGETLDPNFVHAFFKQAIASLVFDKFTNIYGFLAKVVLDTNDLKINAFYDLIRSVLLGAKFQNKNGPDSKLEPFVVEKIIQDIILPLFPKPKQDLSLLSIDYIYAQAGAIFLLDGENLFVDYSTNKEEKIDGSTENQFNKYVTVAHAVEQSVIAGEVEASALKIFEIPALVHYVFKNKEKLKTEKIPNVIYDQNRVSEAFKLLFLYINTTFTQIENVQNNDYKYQFYLALYNFKNRTTLAREIIEKECQFDNEKDIENKINDYKSNPKQYECNIVNKSKVITRKVLPNINQRYQDQVNFITDKFLVHEKESIREAFGNDRIKSWTNLSIEISQGLFESYYSGGIGFDLGENQLIKESDALFRFYFLANETEVFYALIRQDNNVSLIQESGDSENFRQKLGLSMYQKFQTNYFNVVKKQAEESFDIFINRIADRRAHKFNESLLKDGYDQTNKEWWFEFGLSLIPFYTCGQKIRTKNIAEAVLPCLFDGIFIFPVAGEIGYLSKILTTATTKSLLSLAGTTFESLMLRRSLSEILSFSSLVLAREAAQLSAIFTKEVFKKLGLSIFRSVDPGFELMFSIGKTGLMSIVNLLKSMEKYLVSFKSIKYLLEKKANAVVNFQRKIGTMFERDVYVKYLSNQKDSGYGYKFIYSVDNKIAEIRTVLEYKEEMPVIFDRIAEKNKKIYNCINPYTGKIKKKNVHFMDSVDSSKTMVISNDLEKQTKFQIRSKNPEQNSDFGKVRCKKPRSKRSPVDDKLCSRTELLGRKRKLEEDAVAIAVKSGRLSERKVFDELGKYAFPEDGRNQEKFVEDWIRNEELELPSWSKKYKIEKLDLYQELMYKEKLDAEISEDEARSKIHALYPLSNSISYDKHLSAKHLAFEFSQKKAYNYLRFEDFYALQNYGGIGYRKMLKDTKETRRIKNALYRLAIRQSNDPLRQYDRLLYRGETRPINELEEFFKMTEYELTRFTSTSTDKETAEMFSEVHQPGFLGILFEIKLPKTYLRAKVDHFLVRPEKETILLPRTKFRIRKIEKLEGEYSDLELTKIELEYVDDVSKFEQKKQIMQEIKELEETGTAFYMEDLAN